MASSDEGVHHNVFGANVEADESVPKDEIRTRSNVPPAMSIHGDGARKLLTFRVDGGQLKAEYDPADLDEAATVFVEMVTELLDRE